MKTCTKCKETKPLDLFFKGRYRSWCKRCQSEYGAQWRRANKDKVNSQKRQWKKARALSDPEWTKSQWVRDKYGLGREQYQKMLSESQGLCEICRTPTNKLHIDHNHATGEVRGLLCRWCNYGLGNFKDNPDSIESAVAYLRKYRKP